MVFSLLWLLERMKEQPDRDFIIWREQRFTYRWLVERIEAWRARLDREGIGPSQVVAIEGDFSPESIAAMLALVERNDVLVPLTSSVHSQKELFCEIAQVQHIVAFGLDGMVTFTPTGIQVTHALVQTLIDADHSGLVLFSSGSTGTSKAAIHDLHLLTDKFRVRRRTFVTIAFLLFDHIGGFNTVLYALANLGTIVTVEDRRPDSVCRAIETYRVELLPTSPTFLNLLLLSGAHERYELSSLRRVTYGTEVMPQRTLAMIREVLPHVDFQQTYGLSELGIMSTKSRSSDSLWVKLGGAGFETKVVDGILFIRARSAMLGYLNAPNPFDADGWFNTGDAVEVDGEYVRILGRRSEIINIAGLKVYPSEVESVLLGLANVRDVAVAGEANAITGNIVVARFNLLELEELADFRRRVRAYCQERLPRHQTPAKIEVVEHEQFNARFKKIRLAKPLS
jgi:acyl-CoA synthetase (AMP-forming)/AMP-acid ligase II